jgi:prepilin-type N-terminal cleavage/methylation domain-containing protein
MRRQKGFTLVEIMVSIAVGLVIIVAIYAAVATGQRSSVSIERKVVAHQDARAALELMSLEIQMASFNPTYTTGLWRDPGACNVASGNQNYRGIQVASATSITIEADINENGAIGDANEVITYSYDAANQYITRSTNCGGNMPFLGDNPAANRPRAVRVINTDAVPVFRYYNAQGAEITAAELPAGIPSIARIDIVLWVETEDVDANTNERRRMVYSTNIIPRNHVIIQ